MIIAIIAGILAMLSYLWGYSHGVSGPKNGQCPFLERCERDQRVCMHHNPACTVDFNEGYCSRYRDYVDN